jgi:predicted nucleotidyltransferase
MENINSIIEILKKHKSELVDKYGLSQLAIFGSYARRQQRENSDVDILVEFNRPIGLEFIDLAEELEQILQIKVDLVSKKGIKKKYFKSIETELAYP